LKPGAQLLQLGDGLRVHGQTNQLRLNGASWS
jgi:hypothetical protein